jgi:hypothetical protein
MFFKNVRRVSLSPTANSLSSARELAHGKEALCRPLVAMSVLPCVTHGKVFAVCIWAFAVSLAHGKLHVSYSFEYKSIVYFLVYFL